MDRLVVTMGDPAGIGPEVVVRALHRMEESERRVLLVVGEAGWLNRVAVRLGAAADLDFVELEADAALSREGAAGSVMVVNPLHRTLPVLEPGRDYAEFGAASFAYVKFAVELIHRGDCRGLVTAPISKHAWHLAGHDYPGHTELLQELDRSPRVGMMFWGERLKVMLLTTHLPLMRVGSALSVEMVVAKVELLHQFLLHHGRSGPLALAGLNPHAGEQGAFGDEEERILEPALQRLWQQGIEITGPVPADVLFHQALGGNYAAVVALYHDQGLIPFKMTHFRDGVNLSLGLSFVRTSVDHGTAFDISGEFIADCGSMENALHLARELVSI